MRALAWLHAPQLDAIEVLVYVCRNSKRLLTARNLRQPDATKRIGYDLPSVSSANWIRDHYRDRRDISEWALHFIHDYSSDGEPADTDGESCNEVPYHHDSAINDRFESWRISDEYHGLGDGADALDVLLKIITDGHIRATWAFRSRRPTIYGPRAAVCFTEMPLYALRLYSKRRSNNSVRSYAVGVLKNELFAAGGRPVIYGLSGTHLEETVQDGILPRKLAHECGIAESEQYRYVAMSSDPARPIDWSHEREWRWVDHDDSCSCPGLPIWLSGERISFSRVFVVVPESSDVERVLTRLQELHDAGSNDFDQLFSVNTLAQTSIVALDQLEAMEIPHEYARLEDVPVSHVRRFRREKATQEFVVHVRRVLFQAKKAAEEAASRCQKASCRAKDGVNVADVAGWAHLYTRDAQSRLVSALLELDEVWTHPGSGYCFKNIGGLGWRGDQALRLAEAAVLAAKAVFEQHFPDVSFSMETRWD